jgi:hypothetical protein
LRDKFDRTDREPDGGLVEVVDGAVRRLATAIAIAGALIGLGIYARPGPPRFEAFATPTGFIRIDTRSGTVIGCETGRCMTLLRRHQDLAPNPNRRPDSAPTTRANETPRKALPAPATAPAPDPAVAPATAPAPANR